LTLQTHALLDCLSFISRSAGIPSGVFQAVDSFSHSFCEIDAVVDRGHRLYRSLHYRVAYASTNLGTESAREKLLQDFQFQFHVVLQVKILDYHML